MVFVVSGFEPKQLCFSGNLAPLLLLSIKWLEYLGGIKQLFKDTIKHWEAHNQTSNKHHIQAQTN